MVRTKAYFFQTPEGASYYSKFRLDKKSVETVYRDLLDSIMFGTDIVPAALTKTNDTNITLTLGGTPATSLLQAISLTLGWTGTLSIARGGNNSNTALNNDRVMISSGGSIVESSTITTSELALLNDMLSVSTGTSDNDKLVTQGYVDDNIKSRALTTVYKTADYTATSSDDVIIYTGTALADKTVTLPDLYDGKALWIRQGDQTNDVIVSANDLTTDGLVNINTYTITGAINAVYCVQDGTGVGYQWNIIMITG